MGMYRDLESKRVVITGGASGIGLATAKRFINEGAKVVILDWNQETLNRTLSSNPKLSGICVDVSDPNDIEAAFKKVDGLIGGIDILVSNAGISVRKPNDLGNCCSGWSSPDVTAFVYCEEM